jgi:phosphoglycerate dehydrogenase-like enzyme
MGLRIAVCAKLNKRPYGEYMVSKGFTLTYIESVRNTEDEVIANLRGFDGIIAFGEPFTEKVFKALKGKLKIVCRFGLGYDLVDIAAATRHGVCVTNTAGMMAAAVAETALTLILECGRRFAKYDEEMQQGLWTREYLGTQLEGKTIGIIGFGSIGQRLAQYSQGFRCTILAYDVNYNEEALLKYGVKKATLDQIAERSDYVSVHCPLTAATKGIVGDAFLSKMKPTAYLINTSRGPTVDERALEAALGARKIAGAGCDVFEHEPLEADSGLRGLHNVILAPHIGSFTSESQMETTEDIMASLTMFEGGQVPTHCLNPDYVNSRR